MMFIEFKETVKGKEVRYRMKKSNPESDSTHVTARSALSQKTATFESSKQREVHKPPLNISALQQDLEGAPA